MVLFWFAARAGWRVISARHAPPRRGAARRLHSLPSELRSSPRELLCSLSALRRWRVRGEDGVGAAQDDER